MKSGTRIKLIYAAVCAAVAGAIVCTVLYRRGCVWASWYGPHFQGKKTANGEVFNMYNMTAASRTLPFGTVVEVTNCSNHKSVCVRINDRGPYRMDSKGRPIYPLTPHPYRALDLSYAAAKKLGMIKKGVARVRIQVVETPAAIEEGRKT